MPYRPRNRPVASLIGFISEQLRAADLVDDGADLRTKVKRLIGVQRQLSDLGVSVAHSAGITAKGAKERILQYFIRYVGAVIDGEELQVVSGISEYARRVRELRKEQGYQIASGASPDPNSGVDLRPDQYVLVSAEPDQEAAGRWHVANRIRRMGVGARRRALEFLRENVGKIVTTEELAYVCGGAKEFARRVRELRTEHGYLIATKFTGRPDLQMGQYVLESLDRRAQLHDRHIPIEVVRRVYERDHNRCVSCGWDRSRWTREDPRILELHHVEEHRRGGSNTEDNLVVVCSRCHDDVHARRLVAVVGQSGIRFERSRR